MLLRVPQEPWTDELQSIAGTLDYRSVAGTGTKPELSAQAKARLITIQQEETELATAMYDCGGDPLALRELYRTIADDHEQAFIDDNRDDLKAFREQHRTG